jgi:inner membrane protein
MDNLTHSLAGGILGQMGLKKKTGLGMATLIIGANIPDIDAVAVFLGGHQHLAIRRGITHGPIAMVLLPLLLWQAMLAWDRLQTRLGSRPPDRLPIHSGWLLALAFVGTLSHPALDWLNVYGIRLLEPFSSQWFYGDTLFIIDIWVWIALIAGLWLSRRREKHQRSNWRTPAIASFAAVCLYVLGNGVITGMAETRALQAARDRDVAVANPPPVTFWHREVEWRGGGRHGGLDAPLFGAETERRAATPIAMDDPRLKRAIAQNPDARAFMFWARMPFAEIDGDTAVIRDQRFLDPRVGDRFAVRLVLEPLPK